MSTAETADAPADRARLRRRRLAALVAICAAAAVPYLSTIDDYFVRDDFGVVQLLAGKPATYFPRWFASSWMDRIWGFVPDEVRPFPAASYQITALWGAGSPIGHHLLNIALHAANGVLVYAAARWAATLGVPAAAFAGLVFVLLPVHTESVAWITGRVDTMPALFYLASFLAYVRWRAGGRSAPAMYAWSLALFFVALFTKQNTITMVGTLAAYDVIVGRVPLRSLPRQIPVYAPFVALTAGYLGLRLVLFGEVAREGQISLANLPGFLLLLQRHLSHVVLGRTDGPRVLLWAAVAFVLLLGVLLHRKWGAHDRWRAILFFGPVWWVIGVAPIAVAGYESPRHVYLAAVGWAVCIAVASSALLEAVPLRARRALAAAAAVVLVLYGIRLHAAVRAYNEMSAVSLDAVRTVEAEALAAPPGALVIVGVPIRSWEWALPFAVQPPFASTDLTRRVFVVSPQALHCCRGQWFDDTRRTLRAWSAGPAPDSSIVLGWDDAAGAPGRSRSADNPSMSVVARALMDIDRPDVLDRNIQRLIAQFAKR